MFAAQTNGKIPSELIGNEDLLTSSVFGFLNYADRTTYLPAFLGLIGIHLANEALESAVFEFWPSFEDSTEPDVVIRAGKYFILVEAKYRTTIPSSPPTQKGGSQLDREVQEGAAVAAAEHRDFAIVVITTAYRQLTDPYLSMTPGLALTIPKKRRSWVFWREVYAAIETVLTGTGESHPNPRMTADFMRYLDRLNLRSFRGFDLLGTVPPFAGNLPIFLDVDVTDSSGAFCGFGTLQPVRCLAPKSLRQLFFVCTAGAMPQRGSPLAPRHFHRDLPTVAKVPDQPLFFTRGAHAHP